MILSKENFLSRPYRTEYYSPSVNYRWRYTIPPGILLIVKVSLNPEGSARESTKFQSRPHAFRLPSSDLRDNQRIDKS